MHTFNMPVIPAYKPDQSLVAAIRAAIQARKLHALSRAVEAARKIV